MARSPAPTLRDGVVRLRGHTEDDIPAVVEQCTDPLTVTWTGVPVPYTPDDAKRFVREAMPGGWRTNQEWGFALEHEGRFAGTLSLRNEGPGRAELAYGAHPAARGTGAVERGLRLLLEWGFDELEVRTVTWWANRGNWASRRLAWRLGFDIVPGVVRRWLPQRGELVDAWVGTLAHDDERTPRHPWHRPVTIEGERVRLRGFREDDLPRYLEAYADGDTVTGLPHLPLPFDEGALRQRLEARREQMARGTSVSWVFADARTDRLLGDVALHGINQGQAELGYLSHPDARGRGLSTDAVRLALRHAWVPTDEGGLEIARVHAVTSPDNAPSRALMERVGMEQYGRARLSYRLPDGSREDDVLYDILAPGTGS